VAGEPIATITCNESERIVGFLPPDFPVDPRVGMDVQVRTRTIKRRTAPAKILGVSPHLEPITNYLVTPLVIRHAFVPAMGLRHEAKITREIRAAQQGRTEKDQRSAATQHVVLR